MCGIFCSVSATHFIHPDEEIQKRLQSRGPDSTGTVRTHYPKTAAQKHDTSTRDIHIVFSSSVLSLRGDQVVNQPYAENDRYTLCWNGEVWSIGGKPTLGNDTQAVYRWLVNALKSPQPYNGVDEPLESAAKLSRALSQVAGPYAFVFFDHSRGRLFVGRDFLGRRSLLKRFTHDGDVIISSVSDGDPTAGWSEIDADGIYCVDFHVMDAVIVWPGSQYRRWGRFVAGPALYNFTEITATEVPTSTNVVQRLSLKRDIPVQFLRLDDKSPAVARLQSLLSDSVSLRVLNIPEPPVARDSPQQSTRAKLAILFSGGLDCTVLACLAHALLPASEPVDLLNVAFQNPRVHKTSSTGQDSIMDGEPYELCPDRITGRASCSELQRVCPGRRWRFVAINVPFEQTTRHRQKIISLMHPQNTEMDLSIAMALYFAARGSGQCAESSESKPEPYTTTARVLLSGLGADELFAGYTRHATAFKRNGFRGLLDELDLDVSRLGQRNLGRDDRVMSKWGREVRYPYLDEALLAWALDAPVTDKCGFGEPGAEVSTPESDSSGQTLEPGKKVLRCLAWKLGMRDVAREKKRAIQFGARTAKMETGKTKGTQVLS